MVTIDQIRQLREQTGVSIIECKKALDQSEGDFEKAKELLRKWGKELAGKKSAREAKQGLIDSYIHPNKKVGVLLDIGCETDFVAKSKEFTNLSHEICLHIAAMSPISSDDLMSQPWIKDDSKTIKDLISDYIAKLGENITIKNFARYEI